MFGVPVVSGDELPLIAGGEEVDNPGWIVAVFRDENYICTGVLIDPRVVLTAAHCVEGNTSPSDVRAAVGRHDVTRNGQVKQVASIHVHPQYTGANDIAILKLASAINMVNPSSGYTPAPVARNAAASNEGPCSVRTTRVKTLPLYEVNP